MVREITHPTLATLATLAGAGTPNVGPVITSEPN